MLSVVVKTGLASALGERLAACWTALVQATSPTNPAQLPDLAVFVFRKRVTPHLVVERLLWNAENLTCDKNAAVMLA